MQKLLSRLFLFLFIATTVVACKKDSTPPPPPPPPPSYDVQEGQTNWVKMPYDSTYTSYGEGYAHTSDIVFATSNTGFITITRGGYGSGGPAYVVFMTHDGGSTWQPVSSLHGQGGFNQAGTICFPTPSKGIVTFHSAVGYLFQTSDGGSTWSENDAIDYFWGPQPAFAIDELKYIVADQTTVDGGLTWQAGILPGIPNQYDFFDFTHGFGVMNDGIIAKTPDFGLNWQVVYTNAATPLLTVTMIDTNIVFAGGPNGILKTIDGGANWSSVYSGEKVNDILFVNTNVGFAACTAADSSYSGFILKTIDAGNSWQINYESEFMEFTTLHAIDQNTIVSAGRQLDDNELIDFFYYVKTATQGN